MKNTHIVRKLLVLGAFLIASTAFAATYYVDGAVASSGDGLSASAAFKTVEEGLSAATADGDEIVVAAGTYAISATIDLAKAITLRGATGNPADVTLDGANATSPLLKFSNSGARASGVRLYRGGSKNNMGGSVWMASGGTLENSIVEAAYITGNAYIQSVGVYVNGGGRVVGCVVKGCKARLTGSITAVGVRIVNGSLEDSLVTGNYRADYADSVDTFGAVYLEKGLVRNCTIAGNTVSHYPLYVKDSADCTVVDTIAWGNVALRDSSAGRPNVFVGAGANVTNLCTTGSFGVTPLNTNPCFTDAAGGDYSLMPGSPCIGAGVNGGDLGYRQHDAVSPALGIRAGAYRGVDSLATTVTLSATGYDLDGAAVAWDGIEETGATITHTFGPGTHSLTARVTLADSTSLSVTLPNAITVTTTAPMFVDAASAAPAAPYGTPATAARTIDDALALAGDGSVIYVTNGTYQLSKYHSIFDAVKIIGIGEMEKTIVKAAASSRFFVLGNAGALVSGLWMTGGYGSRSAGGIYVVGDGGTVSNCVINSCKTGANVMDGCGIRLSSPNALCVATRIMNCGSSYGKGAGVYIETGTLSDCVVVSNKPTNSTSTGSYGGGVYLATSTASARVLNCTVADNSSYYGGGIYRVAGAGYVCNTIAYGNTATSGEPDINAPGGTTRPAATCFSNTCSSISIGVSPQQVSAAPYELPTYELSAASGDACIDKGLNDVVFSPLDIAGNPRIFRGAVDIGAYEYSRSDVMPGIAADRAYAVGDSERFVFTATVQGAEIGDCACAWYFDGETAPAATQPVITNFFGVGRHDVRLVVALDGREYEYAEAAFVTVYPAVVFADGASRRPEWPYDTPEKAATNLNEAVGEALREGGRLMIAEGIYDIGATLNIGAGMTVTGAGRYSTILNGLGERRVLAINGAGAYVEGLCVSNGANARGSGVYIYGDGGTFADGRITQCVGTLNQSAGGAFLTGANSKITRCVIDGNRTAHYSGTYGATLNYSGGGALVESYAVLENSLVFGNMAWSGAGVAVENYGILRNCVVVGNTAGGSSGGSGGVKASLDYPWGTVVNCVIRDNVDLSLDNPGAVGHNVVGVGQIFSHNAIPVAYGSDCVTDDPLFRDPANGDYRITWASPCVGAGLYQGWMDGATDFYGGKRARGHSVDIGLFQTTSPALRLTVR